MVCFRVQFSPHAQLSDNSGSDIQTTNLLFTADFVTASKGSGFVHIAPAHGHDDYLLGRQYKLDTSTCLVDEEGTYTADAGPGLSGKTALSDGSEHILHCLKSDGLLLHSDSNFVQSYPYDWRTKKPVILRASDQWFIDVEKIRPAALESLDKVEIIPEKGRKAMKSLILDRPYWCISRQRIWGVPIPVFYSQEGKTLMNEHSIAHIKSVIEEKGADAWWTENEEILLPEKVRKSLKLRSGDKVKKGTDILDIWFESGTSWAAVVGEDKVADVYLEGHDQYGAWFQTSLLTSVALR